MEIRVGNVTSIVVNASAKTLSSLEKEFSTYAPGYMFTPQYNKFINGKRIWDGKVGMFLKDQFSSGMLDSIVEKAREPVTIVDERALPTMNLGIPTFDLRDYQWEAIEKAFSNTLHGNWWPRGILKIPTGGGKTAVASAMIQMANVQTLFIVNTKDLLWQAHKVFTGYGIPTGVIGDGQYDVKSTTVATVQSLLSLFKTDPSKLSFLKDIKQVFFDEAHLLAADLNKGNWLTKIAGFMPNAFMRWGLTATPFMKDEYSNWLLKGVTGPIVYSITNKELIDKGFLASGEVTMFDVPRDVNVTQKWPDCYDEAIVSYRKRNKKIVELVATKRKPILILVQREGHGKLLSDMCSTQGLNVPFIFGKNDSKERAQAVKDLVSGQIDAVIASTIWDQGIDIPSIETLILAGAGKSPVRNLQRLGRGLRISPGKTNLEVYDFYDHSTKWLREHSSQRKNLWVEEGFNVTNEPL